MCITHTTCLDLVGLCFDGVAESVKSFADIRSWHANHLLLQFDVDALEVAQFRLPADHCLRLLDEPSLHRVHLQHHLVHVRVAALQNASRATSYTFH